MGVSNRTRVLLAVAFFLSFSSGVLSAPSHGITEDKFVILADAARYYGAEVSWKPADGKLLLSSRESHAEIRIGSDRVLVDNHLLMLAAPVRVKDGAVFALAKDAAAILSRLLQENITQADIVSAGLAAPSDPGTGSIAVLDSVRYITYPLFTRLIISLSSIDDMQQTRGQLVESEKTLSLILSRCRVGRPEPPVEINDGTVGRLQILQEGPNVRLLIDSDPAKVSYEMQKYNNPPRIIVDIRPDVPAPSVNFGEQAALPPLSAYTRTETEPPHEQFSFSTVVIDPGHGGKDVGAASKNGLMEKDIALDIALRMKQLLQQTSGVKVVLTRTGDYFLSLEERTIIANKAKDGAPADLFISIHTNSHRSPTVGGFETYYVSDVVDPSAEATAAVENAVINLENPDKKNVNTSVAPILWDLQFTEFVSESSELAFIAEKALVERLETRDRGVRQAKFIVLSGVAMPSILIEIGYISNRAEEAKMKTAEFKDACAQALAAAIVNFKQRREVSLGLLDRKTNP